jgi:hypothetical protein
LIRSAAFSLPNAKSRWEVDASGSALLAHRGG